MLTAYIPCSAKLRREKFSEEGVERGLITVQKNWYSIRDSLDRYSFSFSEPKGTFLVPGEVSRITALEMGLPMTADLVL